MPRIIARNPARNSTGKLRGVLFDWDGTLLNSYAADSAAYIAMFAQMGIPWGHEELAQHYSPDWYATYRAAGLHESRWDEADLAWRTHYALYKSQLLPGARTLLAALRRKYALGLVTSGDRERVTGQLRAFRLLRTFSVRVCGGDTKEKKPHPGPLLKALDTMKLAPEDCVYVGDTREDVLMARAGGVRSIGITGPFPTADKLRSSKPDVLLPSLAELPTALRSLSR
jgi:HAD superfamily hydrolase (TIGR01509 family)